MSDFTLDDIRAAADKKYASTFITVSEDEKIELVNAIRLSKEDRKKLAKLQDLENSDDAQDVEDTLRGALALVARTPEQAERLLELIGDDMAVLAIIFNRYTGETELGEASGSES